jgi:hypothetical protein
MFCDCAFVAPLFAACSAKSSTKKKKKKKKKKNSLVGGVRQEIFVDEDVV